MKRTKLPLLAVMLCYCLCFKARAQEYKEHITKEFNVSKDAAARVLLIYNITGFIKIEGYAGDKVLMEIDETITADDAKNVEIGKKDVKLGFDQKQDSLVAYIAEPYDSRPRRGWYYNDERREAEYRYRFDYTIKVPYSMNLHIGTVNNGFITVNNVNGSMHITNVNAGIKLTNVKGTTYARTVNGDVTVEYADNPSEASSYSTINGNINVSYKAGLAADVQFKSLHGNLYTDFENITTGHETATVKKDNNGSDNIYRLNKINAVLFGSGGKTFKFETLNGNVYIKKQS